MLICMDNHGHGVDECLFRSSSETSRHSLFPTCQISVLVGVAPYKLLPPLPDCFGLRTETGSILFVPLVCP
jgi:hypothetical protein